MNNANDITVGNVYSVELCGRRFMVLSFGKRYKRRNQVVNCQWINKRFCKYQSGAKFSLPLYELCELLDSGKLYNYNSYE